jgi:cytoskeletal protein CcmA (bactofilin family)
VSSSKEEHRYNSSELEEIFKTLPANQQDEDSIISRSLVIKGNLVSSNRLVIEGQIEGNVTVPEHEVIIGQAGQVSGEVSAKAIITRGKVSGTLSAAQSVTLSGSAVVRGKIAAPSLSIEEGCQFNGQVKMSD